MVCTHTRIPHSQVCRKESQTHRGNIAPSNHPLQEHLWQDVGVGAGNLHPWLLWNCALHFLCTATFWRPISHLQSLSHSQLGRERWVYTCTPQMPRLLQAWVCNNHHSMVWPHSPAWQCNGVIPQQFAVMMFHWFQTFFVIPYHPTNNAHKTRGYPFENRHVPGILDRD